MYLGQNAREFKVSLHYINICKSMFKQLLQLFIFVLYHVEYDARINTFDEQLKSVMNSVPF